MKIESYERGCEICGYDPANLPDVSKLPACNQKAQIASYKLFVISEASWKGEGKKPDFDDAMQDKWAPYFYMKKDRSNPTGFRFYDVYYSYTGTYAGLGSRLCYPSDQDARYHGKQHESLYRDLMVTEE